MGIGAAITYEDDEADPADFLAEVVELLRAHAYYADAVEWRFWEPEMREVAEAATSTRDTYPLVVRMIGALGDEHTRLFGSEELEAMLRGDLGPQTLPVGTVEGDVGVLTLPATLVLTDIPAGTAYISAARGALEMPACGWILDVRGNTGGNLQSMLLAVAPLLGTGPALSYQARDGSSTTFSISDRGELQYDRHGTPGTLADLDDLPFRPLPHGVPVAVVHDDQTASAGEGVLMAFLRRPHARTFGTQSFGVPTFVDLFELSDGAVLAITTGVGVDAAGDVHHGPIHPQERTPDGGDPIERARAWLADHDACRA